MGPCSAQILFILLFPGGALFTRRQQILNRAQQIVVVVVFTIDPVQHLNPVRTGALGKVKAVR